VTTGNPSTRRVLQRHPGVRRFLQVQGAEPSTSLPPLVREQLETVAVRMDMGVGPWRLEVEFEDGRVRRWFRREGPLGALALVRFDRGAA
jgi:hypothetical protein